jgi:hypothetical protein
MVIVDISSGLSCHRDASLHPPRLGMARNQMLQPLHLRHPTRALDSLHVGAKPPLPHARLNDDFALGVGDLGVLTNVEDAATPIREWRSVEVQ